MLDPDCTIAPSIIDQSERFWGNVDVRGQDECWPWTAARAGRGYGQMYCALRRKEYAHRISYRLCVGPIPKGMFVCHKCDNPICVNPSHLFLGTSRDNTLDMWSKGRASKPPRRIQHGEASNFAVLTEVDVIVIRRRYAAGGVTQRTLAAEYGVNQATISLIIRRVNWKHV